MTLAHLLAAGLSLAPGARADAPAEPPPPAPPPARGPEVSGSRHDTSPPLRDIPPARRKGGKKVHPVKPLPRPAPRPGPTDGAKPEAPKPADRR